MMIAEQRRKKVRRQSSRGVLHHSRGRTLLLKTTTAAHFLLQDHYSLLGSESKESSSSSSIIHFIAQPAKQMPSLKKTLVLGSGSREHALAWKLAQSPSVGAVFVAPGNGGIDAAAGGKITAVKDLKISDHPQVAAWCRAHAIDLVVVGPEDPLAAGIVDHLQKEGVPVFGPSAAAARIESEKAFAKAFMAKYQVPTARYGAFTEAAAAAAFIREHPRARVVKASGLAAGKGVIVAETEAEALQAVEDMLERRVFGAAGAEVVVEERLLGEEVSLFGLTDGTAFQLMAPAQDHKRALAGDRGLNTGGMGALAPYPLLEPAELEAIRREVFQRTIDGLRAEGTPFVGLLYAGLILTPDGGGPKVIEFNCRFGDPETQSLLALLKSDLYEVFEACVNGKGIEASHGPLQWEEGKVAVGVVVASAGYPAGPVKKDVLIHGLEEMVKEGDGLLVFHGGTVQKEDGQFYTSGGRILTVVALAESLEKAAAAATTAAGKLRIEGSFFRGDIAQRTIRRLKSRLDYKASGVDIEAGNALVEHIKGFAKSTDRAGVMEQIGGFGALFDLKAGAGLKDPILVSGTDGVGTKLKVAIETGRGLDTVGIDLVAMCVNDILVQGAEPLFFLDYFATSRLEVEKAAAVVKGIAEGCRQARSALIGGETAEMPGMYAEGDFDLAGFAVGAVERELILPQKGAIVEGDLVIGLSSSGVHSNGFSLVRKILEVKGVAYDQPAPFAAGPGKTFADVLLTPTKIYVQSTVPAIRSRKVKALAHITGGGLTENIPRVLEKHLAVELDAAQWPLPPIFTWLKTAGGISEPDMLKTFNCGLGMVLFVAPADAPAVLASLKEHGEVGHQIGRVVAARKAEGEQLQVKVANFGVAVAANREAIFQEAVPAEAQKPKKKVAVLISGSGTNLKAIIEHVAAHQATTAIDLALVVSDKRSAPGLKFAEEAGISTQVLVKRKEQSREQYDEALSAALRAAGIELVCLAGFMRLLSDHFVASWLGRLVNIHPALLPSFKGVDAYGQALAAGVRYTGCTAHFVTAEMDAGPIIDQGVVEVRRGGGGGGGGGGGVVDTVESLTERGKAVEHQVYPRALEAVASGRVVATVGEDGSSLKVVFN